MNLYLISQDENTDYDTYDSAVVVAATEDEARDIHPGWGNPIDWDEAEREKYGTWARHRDRVHVKFLGVSNDRKSGVVCASFNAG